MKWILLAGAVALAVIGGGAYYLTMGQPEVVEITDGPDVPDETAPDFSTITEMVLGNPDAPVEVIEYASFTCPHCANFHTAVFKDLRKNYIDTDKIKFTYREVYFDKFGMWASLIARCDGPEKFFGLADMIYKSQGTWVRASGDEAIRDELMKIGRLAAISQEDMQTCLADGEKLDALLKWYQYNAQADGIDSTPSFIVNGQKYSNMTYADFSALLDEKLAE